MNFFLNFFLGVIVPGYIFFQYFEKQNHIEISQPYIKNHVLSSKYLKKNQTLPRTITHMIKDLSSFQPLKLKRYVHHAKSIQALCKCH